MEHEIERAGALWIALAVSRSKLLHQAIDLLRLARQPEATEEHANRRYKLQALEVELIDVRVHHFLVEPVRGHQQHM